MDGQIEDLCKSLWNRVFYEDVIQCQTTTGNLLNPLRYGQQSVHCNSQSSQQQSQDLCVVFRKSLNALVREFVRSSRNAGLEKEEQQEQEGVLVWDKDNKQHLDFIYSVANLRANNFGIRNQCRFKVKEMAGNIIAAVSSTNAIAASLQVLEAIKILAKSYDKLRVISVQPALPNNQKIIRSLASLEEIRNPQVYLNISHNF
jgi:hypothetical protein